MGPGACAPAAHGAATKDTATSWSPDSGCKAAGDSGKRQNGSRWTSEDLGCGSETRRDTEAGPEWTGAADSQRASSLDASKCLSEKSGLPGTCLVRSTALEDLTSIEDKSLCINQREVLSEQTEEVLDADGGRSQSPSEAQQGLSSGFDSEHLQPAHVSEEDGLCTKQPRDPEACSSRDSSPHKDISSTPDICNESMNQSTESPPRSSAARKSLVPVAVSTGLFAARTSSVQFTPSTLSYDAASPFSYAALLLQIHGRSTLIRGARCPLPHFSFLFRPPASDCWFCSPTNKICRVAR